MANPTQRQYSSCRELFGANLPVIEQVITFVCRRNHLRAEDAEDFASFARLRLLENECAILAKFEGRCALKTFLSVSIQRMFLDYRAASWGKWRPSISARRLGPVAVLFEQLLGRDGYTFDEACEVLRTNHQLALSPQELAMLRLRIHVRPRRRFETDSVLAELPSGDRAEALVERTDGHDRMERVHTALAESLRDLEPRDRLILTLRFQDGRSIAAIAALLQTEAKGLYRRIDRLLKALRDRLELNGVSPSDVATLLSDSDQPVDWLPVETGNAISRPSIEKGARE